MKKFLPVLLPVLALLLCALAPAGQTRPQDRRQSLRESEFFRIIEGSYESGMYRQDSLMLTDPVGDAYMLRKLDTVPVKLLRHLFVTPLPQLEDRPEKQPYKTAGTVPIDNDRLLNKCAEIMRSHFPDIFPTLGEEHKWSPEASQYLAYGFWHRLGRHWAGKQKDFPAPTFGTSKLLVCLACGWTSRYCVTGREEALRERMLTYPDRGIEPHNLFEESYVLNRGNLYLTFLTCENVLTAMPFRPRRSDDPIQRRLAYIRHDSRELGDNYGAWYHFFGIALYSMMRPDNVGVFVADTESFGSFFYEGPDPQEDRINHYGAIFGSRFRKMLEDAAWWLTGPQDRTDYLVPNNLLSL